MLITPSDSSMEVLDGKEKPSSDEEITEVTSK